mmetsp:Transcript_83128/g.178208  ORF Transcript_83128/g.178208 Transcript_83128/m.178208 type:complete len:419 (-) Transcript_83128:21-1277(-)
MRKVLLLLTALLQRAEGFVVVGYVPEYRFEAVDWAGVVARTTHLLLFSLEPAENGDLKGVQNVAAVLRSTSRLQQALKNAGKAAPQVMVTVGGAGRSQHFAAATGEKKVRRRLARRIVKLLEEQPTLAGVDLDWEAPRKPQEWRDLGRLAGEIRSLGSKDASRKLLITMAYHPRSGALEAFAELKGKKSETSFVDLFDLCHAMTYSQFDHQRHHSTAAMDLAAVEEWKDAGLPRERLTLGLPFFGVTKKGESMSYGQIVDRDPTVKRFTANDESTDGTYFINAKSAAKKVQFAAQQGLAGVAIWELGQDKPASDAAEGSLLRHIWEAVEEVGTPVSFWRRLLSYAVPSSEDQVYAALSAVVFVYLLVRVLASTPPGLVVAAGLEPARKRLGVALAAQRAKEAAEKTITEEPDAAPAEG